MLIDINTPAWLTAVDYLKWPVAVIIIILIFILFFKTSLQNFFSRSKRVKFGEFQMDSETNHQQPIKKNETSKLENVTQIFRPETSNFFRTIIQTDTNFEQLNNDTQRFEALLKYAITISVLRRFELIYDSIYGSQLRLLQDLNATGTKDLGIFQHYYDQGKAQHPDTFKNITLNNYSQFIYNWNLVINDQNNGVQITTLGIDFLKFIVDAGKNIYLPL